MDRLVVMRTFVSVARSATFAGAATDLSISPSLVSRHVADLEKQVGARLVNRTPRSVSLTAAGAEYADFAERILEEIEEIDSRLTNDQGAAEGQLSIFSPKWVGNLDLGYAMGEFIREHPRIRVKFELGVPSDRVYDFLDRGFDVAFHARAPRDSRVKVRRITDLPFMLAASPAYLGEHGTPATIHDLADHRLILHTSDSVWRLGREPHTTQFKVHTPAARTNAYLQVEQFVEEGCGIGLVPRGPAREALEDGRVVEVLPEHPVPSRSLYAVHGPGGETPERVKVFLDFITDWFRRRERP
ncbi:LysR family transcriptional regulator [Microbacterium karelineae]|uniref:LysR family transcriptional regulator n=1 Tax=Microbacterium karelineae TaxID=2654283 RepID=UPI0012E9D3B8|nr:LysR family transcriptional regulator [Microbacterium karelineae]